MTVTSVLRWYRVVALDCLPGGLGFEQSVQAHDPDAALRSVMQAVGIFVVPQASIWRLGDRGCVGAPVRRENVRVRLPLQQAGVEVR